MKYAKVKEGLLQQIQNGTLKPGDRLPGDEECAKACGVSTITVRKAYTELAEEGYLTRIKGRGTFVKDFSQNGEAGEASRLVALLLSTEDYLDTSYMQIIKGAQSMLSAFGYSMIVEWCDKAPSREREVIHKILSHRVEGVMLYPFDPAESRDNYAILEADGLPVVMIDRYDTERPCPYFVGCDNIEASKQAVRELLRLGHEKIKFASYDFFLSSERERFDGYCIAMRQAGFTVGEADLVGHTDAGKIAEMIRKRECTALLCCNDKLAGSLLQALLSSGIKIPQEVSIIGFDDWERNRDLPLGLSTMRQDFEEIGAMAASLLCNVLKGCYRKGRKKFLSSAEPVLRETTAPVPGGEGTVR